MALKEIALVAGLVALVGAVLRVREAGSFPLATLARSWFPSLPSPVHISLGLIGGVGAVAVVPMVGLVAGRGRFVAAGEFPDGWLFSAVLGVGVKTAYVLFEELIFRGALLSQLRHVWDRHSAGRRWVSPAAAVFGSAAIFAAAHGDRSWLAMAIVFIDGLGFGAAFVLTRSLWTPVVWHLAKNLSVWTLLGHGTIDLAPGPLRYEPTGPSWIFGTRAEPGWLEGLATILIVGSVVWALAHSVPRRTRTTPSC